ncbi:unnamed protein product, partial [Effrenium voratum]
GSATVTLQLQPPVDFRVLGSEPSLAPIKATGSSWGEAVTLALDEDAILLANAEYFLHLTVEARVPASRTAWEVNILDGPVTPFQADSSDRSIGVLATGALTATLATRALHASAASLLTVYFRPQMQTSFRYLALTAPQGYDFSDALSPGTCTLTVLLSLPSYCQCLVGFAPHSARIVLPPFSRLQSQEFGFAISAQLPSFALAWIEETTGHAFFALETQTDDEEPIDKRQLSLATRIFPHTCAQASASVVSLVPSQISTATVRFQPVADHSYFSLTGFFLYINAPVGYAWVTPLTSWTATIQSAAGLSPASELLPAGICTGEANVLCLNATFMVLASEVVTLTADIRIPDQNPDVPQDGRLPNLVVWQLLFSLAPSGTSILPQDRWMGCEAAFAAPNRVRRIFSAAVEASNAVVSAENDITFSITTVTEVPVGGAIVVLAPSDVFAFPEPCELAVPDARATDIYGLLLPDSAGAACRSAAALPYRAAVALRFGALPPNAYLFTILRVRNLQTISAVAVQWQVYTIGAESDIDAAVPPLDAAQSFEGFSVLVALTAFIDTELLDPTAAKFTKGRGELNQVVIYFEQALASVAGQTLSVSIPEGFRLPWRDSEDCTSVDARLGVAPVNLADPFGRGNFDPARFAFFPGNTKVACASSPDGTTAYLTVSEALVEISRFYVFRLVVQNADRSPVSNFWRLEFGPQASLPIPGFTMQAFQQLAVSAAFAGAAQRVGQAPPNLLELRFQPSVPVPSGGALQLIPPLGFELIASVPRTSRGVLVKAGARCLDSSPVFIGAGYSFEQCQAACAQRGAEFFSFGIGDRSGECVQETSLDGSEPCQQFIADETSSVYQITPTGNCFRFVLDEDGTLRSDVDCSLQRKQTMSLPGQALVTDPTVMTTVAIFGLAVDSTPLASTKVYTARIAVRNPQAAEQNLWTLQSFSQTLLVDAALLEDGTADGFALEPGLDRLELVALPELEKHRAGAQVDLSFAWAPSEQLIPSDVIQVELPSWLNASVCGSLASESPGLATEDCSAGSGTLRFSLSGALAEGQRMDFRMTVQNPSAQQLTSLPRGELSLVRVSHMRPVTSAAGETLLALASSGATSHAVQLPMPLLEVRQASPPFAVAGHFPTRLELDFRLASSGADQLWVDTSGANPMDFTQAQCNVAAEGQDTAALFGSISCYPGGQLDLEVRSQLTTVLSQLRVEFATFEAQRLYTLKVDGLRLGFVAEAAALTVASSTASSSANAEDFGQAFLLDRSSLSLRLAGLLELKPPGAGSFASLSEGAMFDTTFFLAADGQHFLTMAFVLQAAVLGSERLIVYPATGVSVSSSADFGLAAEDVSFSTRLRELHADDDVFQVYAQSGSPAQFSQRLDVVFLGSGTALPSGLPLSLRLPCRVWSVAAGNGWLLLTSLAENWGQLGSITNTNVEDWPEGMQLIPAFDPRASMVTASNMGASALILVTLVFTPTQAVAKDSYLRVSAPELFLWRGDCLAASSPSGLFLDECWRDPAAPHVVLLPLALALHPGLAYEVWMEALTPPELRPPNRWGVATLSLPSGLEQHRAVVPSQVARLRGFELVGLQARLEPLADEGGVTGVTGLPFLLSFHAAGAAPFAALKLTAPPAVSLHCAERTAELDWRLLATLQRASLARCQPFVENALSGLWLDLGAPISSEWLAVPLRAQSSKHLGKPDGFWSLEILADGVKVASNLIVRSHPETLRAVPAVPSPAPLQAFDCGHPFCAALASAGGASSVAGLWMGATAAVDVALSLSRILAPASGGLAARRFANSFSHGFPAARIFSNFVELAAPQPLRWEDCAVANTSHWSTASWRAVCFGSSAFIFTLGYSSAPSLPLREVITLRGLALQEGRLTLPRSSAWVASWYEGGDLVEQAVLESFPSESVLRMDLAEGAQDNDANGTDNQSTVAENRSEVVLLQQDRADAEECASEEEELLACPEGMFAYGLVSIKLGGDSFLDGLQLLCREELDVGTDHVQWQVLLGSSALSGNRPFQSEEQRLACDAAASGLLVGLRPRGAEWLAGLSVACQPWAAVERDEAWEEAGEELGGGRSVSNCTGLVPINGSELWANCQGIPELKPCPDPEKCCCNENFQYSELTQLCEACDLAAAASEPMRLCPLGMAVIGADVGAVREDEWPPELRTSRVCSLRLRCGLLHLRHWAGSAEATQVASWQPQVQQEDLALPGFAELGLEWWHYAAAGGGLLVILYCLYRGCCASQSANVYGDTQASDRKSIFSRLKPSAVLPMIYRPLVSLLSRLLEPLWRRLLRPVLVWVAQTRAARASWGLAKRVGSCAWQRLTRWFPCLRRLERISLAKAWQTLRDPMGASQATRQKVVRRWEIRRQILAGTFSAQQAKEDLVNQLKRGEINEQELAARQKEIDELVAQAASLRARRSMKDRLSTSRDVFRTKSLGALSSFRKSGTSLSEHRGRGCCCCRRPPDDMDDWPNEEVEQDVQETQATEQPKAEDDDEWEYFWEEDEEEEGFEDDVEVDASLSQTDVLGPLPSVHPQETAGSSKMSRV